MKIISNPCNHQILSMYFICIYGIALLFGHQVTAAIIQEETTTNPTIVSVFNQYQQTIPQIAENASNTLWTKLDASNDTQIRLEDFLLLNTKTSDCFVRKQTFLETFTQGNPELDVVAKELFREFDVTNDGFITESDLQELYQTTDGNDRRIDPYKESDLRDIYQNMDANGDGQLQKQEFSEYFSKELELQLKLKMHDLWH